MSSSFSRQSKRVHCLRKAKVTHPEYTSKCTSCSLLVKVEILQRQIDDLTTQVEVLRRQLSDQADYYRVSQHGMFGGRETFFNPPSWSIAAHQRHVDGSLYLIRRSWGALRFKGVQLSRPLTQ